MTDMEDVNIPTKTYKIVNGHIAGYTDGLPAMRQAIEKLLSTERFERSIYSDNYGVELDSLIGENFDLVKSELERIIRAGLMADDRISSVDDFEIQQQENNILTVSFKVSTIFGDIKAGQGVKT